MIGGNYKPAGKREEEEKSMGSVKNRCWLIIVIAMLIVIPAWSQETGRVIRGRAFVLEDDWGNMRGALIATPEGSALSLFDEKGKLRIQLDIKEDVPEPILFDEKGKRRITLSVNKAGPGIAFCDENEEPSIMLLLTEKGPALALFDEKGNRIGGVP